MGWQQGQGQAYNMHPRSNPGSSRGRVAASRSHRREVARPHYFNVLEVRKVQRALRLHSRLLPPLGFEAANPFAGSVGDVDQD
jgi:hypothetical protein